jgi:hypothetical protein
MRRTGRQTAWRLALFLGIALSVPAAAEVEFYQAVDRNQVGLEDTFRLTIVVSDAPDGAQLQFPSSPDLEILSRSQSSQTSFQFGGGGSGIKRTQKYVLVMKATRVGELTLPAAVLTASGKTYKTEPIRISVKQGHMGPSSGGSRHRSPAPDPFQGFRFPGMDEEDEQDPFSSNIPRSDSDLFLRSSVDRQEVYVGEQVTFSVHIFSRLDLSAVDSVTMPKLEGFLSEDLESPSQLGAEQRVINGVTYRAYLVKRLALFPMKPGTLKIGSTEADITTGFLFTGRRFHRVGNELSIKVKPLPAPVAGGISSANVGKWHLSTELSAARVELGQPVTVRVMLEGRGNLKSTALPTLTGPPSLRIFDPTTTDKTNTVRGKIGGRRVQEYLVMPQQTGTFTLPGLSLSYFDPESERYESSRTEPITLTIVPGTGLPGSVSSAPTLEGSMAKNVLAPGGPHPLRYQARFSGPETPLWRQRLFLPALLAPPGLWLAMALTGFIRSRINQEDEAKRKRRRARAARRRLAEAKKLKNTKVASVFYAEVENALTHFLSAKLGAPTAGLTRTALAERMQMAGVPESIQAQVLGVLESCDVGRFAPGGGDASREAVLEEAQSAMEGWESK